MTAIRRVTDIPGPKSRALLERRANAVTKALGRSTDVCIDRAEGALVHDIDGNTLIDLAGGIGMLAVGILGFPFIGFLQESSATAKLQSSNPAIYETVTVQKNYLLGDYKAIDPVKSAAITETADAEAIKSATTAVATPASWAILQNGA